MTQSKLEGGFIWLIFPYHCPSLREVGAESEGESWKNGQWHALSDLLSYCPYTTTLHSCLGMQCPQGVDLLHQLTVQKMFHKGAHGLTEQRHFLN